MTTDEGRTVGPWPRQPAPCRTLRSSDDGRPRSFNVETTGKRPVIHHHADDAIIAAVVALHRRPR